MYFSFQRLIDLFHRKMMQLEHRQYMVIKKLIRIKSKIQIVTKICIKVRNGFFYATIKLP